MFLRNRLPAAMLDRHARFAAHRLEPHIDLGRLIVAETRQAPGERQPLARQPMAHRTDLPFLAIVEACDEPPARPGGIEAQRAVAPTRKLEQRMAPPPDRKSTRLHSSH